MLDNSFVGLKEQVEQALKLKGIEYTEVKEGKGENKIGMIIFTDGGSRDYGGKHSAGFGVHGYIYLDKEVKSNSNAPSGYPSNTGYSTGILDKGQYKVDVLYYIDFYGACGDETNNYAELLAGLYALEMIKAVYSFSPPNIPPTTEPIPAPIIAPRGPPTLPICVPIRAPAAPPIAP